MASAVLEEYLETIYNMAMEGEQVISARLAEKFRVSRATAGETVKRLVSEGYAVQHSNKSVSLTSSGQELTEQVLRRHRLAERLLFDVLGMDSISAHEQAHALEHWMSQEVEDRISSLLGHPATCPHGNPIPGNATTGPAFLREQHAFRLSEATEGQAVRVVLISEVVEDESAVLRRLSEIGIYPTASVLVLEAVSGEALVVQVRDQACSVGADLASKIWVQSAASNERDVAS